MISPNWHEFYCNWRQIWRSHKRAHTHTYTKHASTFFCSLFWTICSFSISSFNFIAMVDETNSKIVGQINRNENETINWMNQAKRQHLKRRTANGERERMQVRCGTCYCGGDAQTKWHRKWKRTIKMRNIHKTMSWTLSCQSTLHVRFVFIWCIRRSYETFNENAIEPFVVCNFELLLCRFGRAKCFVCLVSDTKSRIVFVFAQNQ